MTEQTGEVSTATKAMAEGVEVIIDGEKHTLHYSLWSFCKLDEQTGKNPLDGASWSSFRPKDLLVLLWAGLQHEPSVPTIEELGRKLGLKEIKELGPLIQKAFAKAMPTEDEKKSSDESLEVNGAGTPAPA